MVASMDPRSGTPPRRSGRVWRRGLLAAAGVVLLVAAAVWLSAERLIAAKLERDLRAAGFAGAEVSGASVASGGVAVRRIRLAGDDLDLEGIRAGVGTTGVERLSVDTLNLRAAIDASGRMALPEGVGARDDGTGDRGALIDLVPPDGLEVAAANVALATPAGPVSLRFTALHVERGDDDAHAEGRYTLEHSSGRLQGTATVGLSRDGTLRARIGVADGRFETHDVRIANVSGDLDAALPAHGPPTIELALTAAAVESKTEPPLWAPLAIEASVRGEGAALDVEALASDALGIVVLEIDGRTEGRRVSADVTLHPLQFVTGATEVADVSPALAEHVSDASGGVGFTGTLEWGPAGIRASGELRIESLSATILGTRISGIDGAAMLSSLAPLATPRGQTLRIAALDVGVPLTDGVVVYGLEPDGRIAVQKLTFELAGGRVSTEPFTVDSGDPGDLGIVLEAEGVDLSQLLALSRIEGLEGTGALSGRVPVRVSSSGIALGEGFLAAQTNGTLRYTPEDLPEFLRGDDLRSRMLREVLTNFQYDELAITITGDSEERAEQLVRLAAKGANPDFLDGHPIELNFNFSGPLLGAVRSAVDLSSAEAVQQLFEQQDERDVGSAP